MLFPTLRQYISLHRTAERGTIIIPLEGTMKGDCLHKGDQPVSYGPLHVDGYLIEYLRHCDGTRDKSEVNLLFANSITDPFWLEFLTQQAWQWVQVNTSIVDVKQEREESPRPIAYTGNDHAFYPLHASLEIIETCNFRCEHCYYSASPDKKGMLTLEQAKTIIDSLHRNGVLGIELTGGECTLHPSFEEIFEYASNTFGLVAIITNGYRIGTDQKLADKIASKNNVVVQISVDGIGERHNQFRRHRNAFEPAVQAIKRLLSKNILVRMACSISEENRDQIVNLFHLAKELNVSVVNFSPVSAIGRGCNVTDPAQGAKRLIQAIESDLQPFRDDPILGINKDDQTALSERNCGAGWRTVAVDYNGEVRACGFSRDSKKFGNLLSDNYDLIFSQKASYFFNNAPSPGGEECFGCKYYMNCKGCFVKAFMVSETEYPDCPWRSKWFPGMALKRDTAREISSAQTAFREIPMYKPNHVCPTCVGV